jgi:hypothetical protein
MILQALAIDWMVVATIAGPLLAVFVGAWVTHLVENRPRLITYLSHTSAFQVKRPEGSFQVFTHAIVIRNTSRRAAQNVRLGHHVLPDFTVFPSIPYSVSELPSGGSEILFPKLVPKEQVTVSYLYFPPTLWDQVNSYTKSDEGFARTLAVIPAPQAARWLVTLAWVLMLVGIVTALYVVGLAGLWLAE